MGPITPREKGMMSGEEFAMMHSEYEEQVYGVDEDDRLDVGLRKGTKSCKYKKRPSVVHQEGITYRWCDKHHAYCAQQEREVGDAAR
jgi:hypothetical protein